MRQCVKTSEVFLNLREVCWLPERLRGWGFLPTRRVRSLGIYLVVLLLGMGCGKSQKMGVHETTETGGQPYHGLIQYRARDSKPAIIKPKFVKASEALLADGTAVIGVSINGQSHAYPLYILNNHQIVNDTVGGTAISASW